MHDYDQVFKYLADAYPNTLAALALGTDEVHVETLLNTEQPTVKTHETDITYRVRLGDKEALLHIEAQTGESREKPMPLRMLAYASFLVLQHELEVYSAVLYFRKPAGRGDPGVYEYGDDDRGRLLFKYNVIRMYELEGSEFLDPALVGLLPFTPLMRPPEGISDAAWIERCIDATRSAEVDSSTRGTLLFALSLFGSLSHPSDLFRVGALEAIMRESPFYEVVMARGRAEGIEVGREQGREQGARQVSVETTLTILKGRFPDAETDTLKPVLEAIDDLDRLKALTLRASLVSSFRAFQEDLGA